MGLKDKLQSFISRQCLPLVQVAGFNDSDGQDNSRLHRHESQNKTRRSSSGMLRSSSAASTDEGSTGTNGKRKYSPRGAIAQLRSARPPTRREQLLMGLLLICMLQMGWMRQAQSNSLLVWFREGLMDAPEPGKPPTRHAYLPQIDVLRSSPDSCAQALGIHRVALMFLTTGELYHEKTWALWFKSAAGVVPSQSMAVSVCHADGVAARLQEANAACRAYTNVSNAIDAQHLFSVYIHAPPSFTGYRTSSLWAGKLVQHRVRTSWGAHTLVEATRHLVWEAYRDPLNTRFLLLSESDVPIYDPFTMWQQLQSETKSRIDTCKHEQTSPWRWDPRMGTSRLHFHNWRKSPQWIGITRDHAELVLRDEDVYRKFEKHCWSAWDDRHARWHRDCFSDEHYFATLMSVEGRDEEGVCEARGVSYTQWEGKSAHPKSFPPGQVNAELFKKARQAPLSATGAHTQPCDWAAAQQAAATLFIPIEKALGAHSVDMCGRMWRQPPTFKAKMPETCFMTARKFPFESRERVRRVFLQCGNGIDLLRPDVCEREGGQKCGTVWARMKGLIGKANC